MKYVLFIYEDETAVEFTPESMEPWEKLGNDLVAAGAMVEGAPLQPTATATSVRIENGNVITSDGPFAETKEQVGGYYVIDVKDMAEAKSWAARIPSAVHGGIEVRQVMEYPDPNAG